MRTIFIKLIRKNTLTKTVKAALPDFNDSTAPLLADTAIESSSLKTIGAEAAIGHNGIMKDNFLHVSILNLGTSQVRTSQVSTNHISHPEIGTNQLGVGKVSSTQAGVSKIDFSTIGSSQVGIHKIGLPKRSSTEVGSAQINTHHIGFAQIGVTQVDTTQVNISQFSNIQLSPSEISLPRSIPSEQFFNLHSHNSSPASIYTINNSAINLWDDLLNLQTSFSVKLVVKNLPTGQLAEAQINSLDASGMPNAGTIFIDDDANGKG